MNPRPSSFSLRPATAGLVAVALAASAWGTVGVAVDLLYRISATDAISVGFWRLALSAPALLLLSRALAPAGAGWPLPRGGAWRRDALALLVMGVAFAGYQLCYFAAIPYIGVPAAVLINIGSAPILVALLSTLFLGERLTWRVGGSLAGAVTGAALLVGGSPQAAGARALAAGAALALGAGFAYSLVALMGRAVAPRYHPLQPVALAFSLSALLVLPVALATGLDWRYSPAGWALLLYLGLVPTALAYGLYLYGLRTTPATIAAIVALLEPLISTVLAVALLGERLTSAGILGGALVLVSVGLLALRSAKAPAPSQPS
jgi:DME family drug/metabolite transporter